MKQVNVHGPEDVRLDEVAEPEPGPRDAVICVRACGICGTDLRYVRLGGRIRQEAELVAVQLRRDLLQ